MEMVRPQFGKFSGLIAYILVENDKSQYVLMSLERLPYNCARCGVSCRRRCSVSMETKSQADSASKPFHYKNEQSYS